MAIALENKTNVDAPSVAYPFGKIRDGEDSGTPVNTEVYGDFHQFFAKLLDEANITPNGQPENATDGFEYIDALLKVVQINTQKIQNNSTASKNLDTINLGDEVGFAIDYNYFDYLSSMRVKCYSLSDPTKYLTGKLKSMSGPYSVWFDVEEKSGAGIVNDWVIIPYNLFRSLADNSSSVASSNIIDSISNNGTLSLSTLAIRASFVQNNDLCSFDFQLQFYNNSGSTKTVNTIIIDLKEHLRKTTTISDVSNFGTYQIINENVITPQWNYCFINTSFQIVLSLFNPITVQNNHNVYCSGSINFTK